jgi:hypothetical protein
MIVTLGRSLGKEDSNKKKAPTDQSNNRDQ